MYCDSVNLRSETCVKDFTDYINQMLEQGKRGQSVNASWVNARNNLITASVMGEVYKRKKLEPDNLLKTCVDM
jgi:dTDP-D-glucose 4,6-dehydratase